MTILSVSYIYSSLCAHGEYVFIGILDKVIRYIIINQSDCHMQLEMDIRIIFKPRPHVFSALCCCVVQAATTGLPHCTFPIAHYCHRDGMILE